MSEPNPVRIGAVRARLALVLCALGAMSCALARGQSEDERLEGFFRRFLEERLEQQPLEATQLGNHRYDNRLENLSLPARAQRLAGLHRTLEQLPNTIAYEKLSRDGQIDFEILKQDLEKSVWIEENTHPFESNPRLYNRYISDSVFLLLTQSRLPKETNIAHAIARMAEIPKVIRAAEENLANPPKPILETAIRQNRGAIDFYEKGIFELAGPTPQLERLKAAASQTAAALRRYQTFLERDLLPRAHGDWRLGERKFSRKLEMTLDAGMTAEEVVRLARSEFDWVRAEMYVVARQLWSRFYPDQALPPDDAEGRRATIRHVLEAIGRDHGKPEALVADARATVQRIKDFIRAKHILRLPEPDRCRVIEMPEFQRGNSLAYMNSAPPLDPAAPSFYAVSPPSADWDSKRVESLLEEYNRRMLQVLTIHEAYPGHYVQLEYANRTPSLIRRVLASGPFIEGWAVYTEQMMLDQGYGSGDLALRLMQLKFYLRAVANAIFDHEMHCTQMSDEEAMRFLTGRAFQSEEEARLKIIRAKQTSCQLSTYFVGRAAIYRLRQQIERELGSQFRLDRFHEAVLAHGSVPVKYLPELVRAGLRVKNPNTE